MNHLIENIGLPSWVRPDQTYLLYFTEKNTNLNNEQT